MKVLLMDLDITNRRKPAPNLALMKEQEERNVYA